MFLLLWQRAERAASLCVKTGTLTDVVDIMVDRVGTVGWGYIRPSGWPLGDRGFLFVFPV